MKIQHKAFDNMIKYLYFSTTDTNLPGLDIATPGPHK